MLVSIANKIQKMRKDKIESTRVNNYMRYLTIILCVLALCGCQKKEPVRQQWPQPYQGPQWQGQEIKPGQPELQPQAPPQRKIEGSYYGTWKTTNRRLDGTMQADVTNLGNDNWSGRFFGTWQGVDFDYTVKWNGPPTNLTGTAVIDRADYQWTGDITDDHFKGQFTGSRYTGYFDLKRK